MSSPAQPAWHGMALPLLISAQTCEWAISRERCPLPSQQIPDLFESISPKKPIGTEVLTQRKQSREGYRHREASIPRNIGEYGTLLWAIEESDEKTPSGIALRIPIKMVIQRLWGLDQLSPIEAMCNRKSRIHKSLQRRKEGQVM
jgi:hypothetical protein